MFLKSYFAEYHIYSVCSGEDREDFSQLRNFVNQQIQSEKPHDCHWFNSDILVTLPRVVQCTNEPQWPG